MKTNPIHQTPASRHADHRLALLLALTCGAASLPAQSTLYWNPGTLGGGGDGTWDTSTPVWNTVKDGPTENQAWNNGASPWNIARFDSAFTNAGTVAVSGTVNARQLVFAGSSYTLAGGTIDIRAGNGGTAISAAGGTTMIGSTIYLFGEGIDYMSNTLSVSDGGTLNLTGEIRNITTGAPRPTLVLRGGENSTINISGNITTSSDTTLNQLNVGASDSGNSARYTLGGSVALGGRAVNISRGTLVLNHSSAVGLAAGSVNLNNANTGADNPDTAKLLIGADGVTIGKAINVAAITANNTDDVRAIGGEHTAGTATFSGNVTLNAFATSGTGSRLEVTSIHAGATTIFSGNINDGTNTVPLLKTGAGIVKFTRAAGTDYDGGTTVSEGVLIVNNTSGSGTGTGDVLVGAGATFGGAGSSSGHITLEAGARLSPGDTDSVGESLAGTFRADSDFIWNSDGTNAGMVFNLGADQASSDQLNIVGAFTKGSGASFIFDFTGSTFEPSFTYTLVGFGSTDFQAATDFIAIGGGDGFFTLHENSLAFTAGTGAIPEPAASATLFGAGVLGLALWRRKRIVPGSNKAQDQDSGAALNERKPPFASSCPCAVFAVQFRHFLTLASLCLAATFFAGPGRLQADTAPVINTEEKKAQPLSWAPPGQSNPTRITLSIGPDAPETVLVARSPFPYEQTHLQSVADGGIKIQLKDSEDAIINLPREGTLTLPGITVVSGRHVRIIGGHLQATKPADQSLRALLRFAGQTGSVFVEGLIVDTRDQFGLDAILAGSQRHKPENVADVYIQNCLLKGMNSAKTGFHADGFQYYGAVRWTRMDRVSIVAQYQGLFLDPQFDLKGIDLRNIDLRYTDPSTGAGYIFWLRSEGNKNPQPLVHLNEIYVGERTNIQPWEEYSIYPPVSHGAVTKDGKVWFPVIPEVTGYVNKGAPPNGPFVTDKIAGAEYVSPGYLAQ